MNKLALIASCLLIIPFPAEASVERIINTDSNYKVISDCIQLSDDGRPMVFTRRNFANGEVSKGIAVDDRARYPSSPLKHRLNLPDDVKLYLVDPYCKQYDSKQYQILKDYYF